MFNNPAFWTAAGLVIVATITNLATWLAGRSTDQVNLLEQQRKDFESVLAPIRADLTDVRAESAANKAENAALRAEVDALKATDRERDGLLNDLLTWARATIQWISDRVPGNEARPQLSQRAWDHINRDVQS